MSIRIIIADDHKIVRDGLRVLLEKHSDMKVVAEAQDGREAIELAKKLLPTVIIMDITMPDLNGIDATRQIVAQSPHTRIIALSMHSDRQFVVRMLEAGACAYLLKNTAFTELALAIRTVVSGRAFLSPQITDVVVEQLVSTLPEREVPATEMLTPREREVLQLLAEGNSTKQTASKLHVSVTTIETHRRHLMEKLDRYSTADLTKFAIREGLTSLDS